MQNAAADDARADRLQAWAGGWRRLVLSIGMLVYPLITLAGIAQYSTGVRAAIGYALVAAFCLCYALAMVATVRRMRTTFWVSVCASAALFVATIPFGGENAFYLCAVVLSLAAPLLRRRIIPFVAVGTLGAIAVPVLAWHGDPGWVQAIMIVFTVLLVYAFSEIARANGTLLEARAEVARLASEAERNRIARDLHDLVGHSLTAITVKSNLARQLAARDESPLLEEVTQVEELSRQALADLRAAVSGYNDVTLATELARAHELLRASGVTADLPTAVDGVPPDRQELFGWVVREGITNVVRHARATRCTITISATRVEVRDDGVGGPAPTDASSGTGNGMPPGNGLRGLSERVARAGGRLSAGPASPSGWRLAAAFGEETAGEGAADDGVFGEKDAS